MNENVAEPINPMLKELEVQRLQRKCEHYGQRFSAEDKDGHLRVTVTGSNAIMFEREGKNWCPNAVIQGSGEPNSIVFLWEKGTFIAAATKAPTKPKGSKPDCEVMDELTRQQIDTLMMLRGVLSKLDKDIEAAYPGVRLANKGYGKGKRDLVIKVLDALHERSSQNVPQFMTYVGIKLARHLVHKNPKEELEIPEPPRASARTR